MAANELGFDNLLWFMGVVEDNNDPQMLGRCKVRAFGIHPPDKTEVPTEDLPWAWLVAGTYNAAVKPPEGNSWVFGFFIDGKNAQHPMLIGSMMGMPTSAPSTDPNQGFMAAGNLGVHSFDGQNPACATMFQPDMSPLARGEGLHNTGIPLANAMTTDGSPPSAHGAQYPHNWVHQTTGGHAFELDDTPGQERINLAHQSGSRVEMDSRGNVTIKSPGDNWVSVDRNGWIRCAGSWNVKAEGQVIIHSGNDLNLVCDGNMTTTVHGNYSIDVAGDYAVNVGLSNKSRAAEHTFQSTTGSIHLDAGEIIQARSSGELYVQSGKGINVNAASDLKLTAAGDAHVKGANVNIDDKISMANGDAAAAGEADGDLGQTKFPQPPARKQPVRVEVASHTSAGASTATDDTEQDAELDPTGSPVDTSGTDQIGGSPSPGLSDPARQSELQRLSQKYGVSAEALAGVISIESGGDPNKQGGAGNRFYGIFQLEDQQIPGLTQRALGQRMTPNQYRNATFAQQVQVYEAYWNQWNVTPNSGFFTGDPVQDAARLWALQLAPGRAKRIDYNNPNAEITATKQAAIISPGGVQGRVTVGSAGVGTIQSRRS